MNGIVIQVLSNKKPSDLIYSVLNEFIPGYEPINSDYTGKPDNMDFEFKSENEMIDFYSETKDVEQTFYWNKHDNNPDRIMVGVNILKDNQIVFSLTIDAIKEKEIEYLKRLKTFLNSEIGVISYVNPADYENGKDFEARYSIN